MVLLLNYLPWIIAIIGVFAVYKSFNIEKTPARIRALAISLFGTIFALVLLQALTAGYIPKARSSEVGIANPAFENSTAEIENRLRSPEYTSKESEDRLAEKSDWRKNKEPVKAQESDVKP